MRKAQLLALAFAVAITPVTAETGAGQDVAVLSRHLNAHGRQFVAKEAKRLAIGDASESGAKDDIREACPQPASCFDTSRTTSDEVVAALQTLAAQRAEKLLEQQINQMTGRNERLKQLVAELQNATSDNERARLRSEIEKLNGDSQLDMIRMQDLINKRNQAFDMLTDLLNKHRKTLDGIVGNMR